MATAILAPETPKGYKLRYFIDTEFIESGPSNPIELISIGIVSEDGREFYAISSEYDSSHASEWVRKNVLMPLLAEDPTEFFPLKEIAAKVVAFVWPDMPFKSDPSMMSPNQRDKAREKPEFWGYYAGYDWVVFCQMFGTMMDLPKGFPMYCRDIKQLCDDLGNPKLPEQGKGEHNALVDARWNKVAFEFLQSMSRAGVSVAVDHKAMA